MENSMFPRKFSNWLRLRFFSILLPLFFTGSAFANEMILIPEGKFIFSEEGKTVDLKGFFIQKFEVTGAEYKKIIKDAFIEKGKENHPVIEVSYFEAEAYCKAIGGRLPTMQEWEKAARGTDGRTYPWGNEFQENYANTSETGNGGTVSVGTFDKGISPYGIYDMAGNVWEWVDAWDQSKRYRFVKGGSYFESSDKNSTTVTLSSIPDDMHVYIGFRCAKNK